MGSKRDPRAEEDDSRDHSVERVVVPSHILRGSEGRIEAKEPASDGAPAPVVEAPPRVDAPPVSEENDTRPSGALSRIELAARYLDRNDWNGLARLLGPLDGGDLTANATNSLLAALAHNEATLEGNPQSIAVATKAVAKLLDVPPDGAVARIVARRLLRKNPLRLRDRPAPPARTTALILLGTVVICAALAAWLFLGGGMGVVRALVR